MVAHVALDRQSLANRIDGDRVGARHLPVDPHGFPDRDLQGIDVKPHDHRGGDWRRRRNQNCNRQRLSNLLGPGAVAGYQGIDCVRIRGKDTAAAFKLCVCEALLDTIVLDL